MKTKKAIQKRISDLHWTELQSHKQLIIALTKVYEITEREKKLGYQSAKFFICLKLINPKKGNMSILFRNLE